MAAFDEHGLRAHFVDDHLAGARHPVLVVDFLASEHGGLVEVGCDERSLGHQLGADDSDRIALEEWIAGSCDHYRVENVVAKLVVADGGGNNGGDGAVPSMPVFIAAGTRSSTTESICARTRSGETASHLLTPRVFCAVMAVTADVPNTPNR